MKLRATLFVIAIVAVLLCGLFLPAGVAAADTTPVVLLSGKAQNDEVVVTANLRYNDGIGGLLLELQYDTDKLTFVGYDKGTALDGLDLMTTNVEGAEGYGAYPFRFSWSGDANDASNGLLLTLHFAVKAGAEGKAQVTFGLTQGQDVNYYEDGDLKTRNLLVDTLRIDLSDGQATNFESEQSHLYDADDEAQKKALTIGLSVGVPVAVVIIVLVPLLVVRKRIF